MPSWRVMWYPGWRVKRFLRCRCGRCCGSGGGSACTGFGGPPAHIRLLRQLCVERQGWLDAREFEDAIAVCNLMPGPASTQLAIFCAWRMRGRPGALVGGAAFIVPGLIVILALSVLFVAGSPPLAVLGAGAGAGGAVPAVAIRRGSLAGRPELAEPPRGRPLAAATWRPGSRPRRRSAPWLVFVLLGVRRGGAGDPDAALAGEGWQSDGAASNAGTRSAIRRLRYGCAGCCALAAALALTWAVGGGVLARVAWVAFKVGGLSFGGGFVIIPLMQADAVGHYHWMTGAQFLNAVALGQVTPGPVVQTVAVVGYAAAGIGGGLLASAVAFAPSFAFVLFGGRHFDRIRGDQRARAFLDGAGPAAIGAIFGSAITLTRELTHPWQYLVLGGALVAAVPAAPRRRVHAARRRCGRRHRRAGRGNGFSVTQSRRWDRNGGRRSSRDSRAGLKRG